jgi:bacillithiol biosynthesis cysteine-adding enzyme BshC
MESECLPYSEIGFLPVLMQDYLRGDAKLDPFYRYTPNKSGFGEAIEQRRFSASSRKVLVEVLGEQYKGLENAKEQLKFINLLSQPETFTVTTGHQLCLLTGPAYFVYKILSVVRLAQDLKKAHPNKNFVPVYWMASEDHDFEEISFFLSRGHKITWNTHQTGAVGRMLVDDVPDLSEVFAGSGRSGELLALYKKAYRKGRTLAEATRIFVHDLLGHTGVLILDADDKRLKSEFASIMSRELTEATGYESVMLSNGELEQLGYSIQVNPRDVNLFYLKDHSRLRITRTDYGFETSDQSMTWSPDQILSELNEHPERFSPNVIMRPLYQETILPNISYSGGAGEMSYWLQLKRQFEAHEIDFPVLMMRDSALVLNSLTVKKMDQIGLKSVDLFKPQTEIERELLAKHSDKHLDLSEEKEVLTDLFEKVTQKALNVDKSLEGATKAAEARIEKLYTKLEEKMLRAEKRNLEVIYSRLEYVLDQTFPSGTFQERKINFSDLYLEYGPDIFEDIAKAFDPWTKGLHVIIPD